MNQILATPGPTLSTERRGFLNAVVAGLQVRNKRLPSKYFYDRRGSELFERICEQPEYYLTRTELEIMRRHGREMAACIGPRCHLIELGSGSTDKIRELLERLETPAAYVPVDISGAYLSRQAARLGADLPNLHVLPLVADFTADFTVPLPPAPVQRRVVFFPGSTIGNLDDRECLTLLGRIAHIVGPGGGFLVGIDLRKERRILEPAYNDRAGVTREFNLNLLHRIRRELHADVDPAGFAHRAFYNECASRIEMHLVSRTTQTIHVGSERFHFKPGETIHTENSHKFDLREFAALAALEGFATVATWIDDQHWFAVRYLERNE